MATDVTRELSGRTLGEFQLLDRLNEGAFGAVYRARQLGLGRPAVVKVLHRRFAAGDPGVARFVREARLASRVDHPCVAHVYAAGCERDGLLWIAMELVQGVTLAEWLKRRGPMPLDEFVPFFDRLAHVVQAAHARGVVHRDIKPANIMVVELGDRLVPKLVDFGVAKLMNEPPPSDFARGTMPRVAAPPAAEERSMTDQDTIIGTWHYVAPELWLSSLSAAAASDLYALGVVAYETLTGRTPFRGADRMEIGLEHLTADIPPAGPGLPPALDTVFARALAKVPEERYPGAMGLSAAFAAVADSRIAAQIRTAARQWDAAGRTSSLLWRDEMLAELEAWSLRTSRADARLTATDTAFIEASREAGAAAEERARAGRTRARRLGWAAAALAATAVFGVAVGRMRYETRLAQQRAVDAAETARRVTLTSEVEQGRAALLHDEIGEAQRHLGEAWRSGDHSSATEFMLARALQPLRAELAKLPAVQGRMWSASWSPDGRQIVTTDDRSAQIWDAASYAPLAPLPHDDVVYAAAWMPGGRLVTACGDGAVRVWNTARGDLVRELRLPGKAPRWYAIAVNGERVAAVDAKGAAAAVWDAGTGAVLAELLLSGAGWPAVAFSGDGRWLAASGGDAAEVVDTGTWRRAAEAGDQVRAIAWDPAGPRLIVGSAAGDAAIWDVPTGRRLSLQLGEAVTAVAFAPDGARAAIGGEDGAEQFVDAATGRIVAQGNYLHARVASLAFSADGQRVVAAGATGELAIGDATSGLPVELLEGPKQQLRGAWFGPTGRRVLAASWDGTTRIWDARSPYRQWSSERLSSGFGLFGGAEPDGRYLAVVAPGAPTRVWDTAADRLLAELPEVLASGNDVPVPFSAVSHTGDRAAIARGNAAELYELPGGRLVRRVKHTAAVTALAFGVGGELVIGGADGVVLVARIGRDPVALAESTSGIAAIAVLPDGRIASADTSGRVRIFDEDGTARAVFNTSGRVRMLRPSPDGHRLLVVPFHADRPAPMTLVDVDRDIATVLDGPPVYAARWVAGGRAILSAHADGAARIWRPDGALAHTYIGGARFLAEADLSPDGAMVIGGGGDGVLRFWDAETGKPLWVVAAHRPYVMGLHVESGAIVTRGIGGEVARWRISGIRGDLKVAETLPF